MKKSTLINGYEINNWELIVTIALAVIGAAEIMIGFVYGAYRAVDALIEHYKAKKGSKYIKVPSDSSESYTVNESDFEETDM